MKVFLISAIVLVAISFGASFVLNDQFQMDSKSAFTTEGARPSDSGAETVSY
jgi:hypothetical protein